MNLYIHILTTARWDKLYHTSALIGGSVARSRPRWKQGIVRSNCWEYKQHRPRLLYNSAEWAPIARTRLKLS